MPVKKLKKKRPKMDRNFVSNQKWEIQYIANKFDISILKVKAIKKECGKSRKKVYAAIREYLAKKNPQY